MNLKQTAFVLIIPVLMYAVTGTGCEKRSDSRQTPSTSQKADTTEKELEVPEWYLNLPQNYEEDGYAHFIEGGSGTTFEKAILNGITSLALSWVWQESNHGSMAVYETEAGEFSSQLVDREMGPVTIVGVSSLRESIGEESSLDESFSKLFYLEFEDGKHRYDGFLFVRESQKAQGENPESPDTDLSTKYEFEESNKGWQKLKEHLESSSGWILKEKVSVGDQWFVLLEYVEKSS